ncbi:MAG: hypothetical protein QNJ53_22385 [Pleurocapsa sp. MO_192.B19]|nr:hypothetical protein [Pleurocapsa sp. MO_192.B19]
MKLVGCWLALRGRKRAIWLSSKMEAQRALRFANSHEALRITVKRLQ